MRTGTLLHMSNCTFLACDLPACTWLCACTRLQVGRLLVKALDASGGVLQEEHKALLAQVRRGAAGAATDR